MSPQDREPLIMVRPVLPKWPIETHGPLSPDPQDIDYASILTRQAAVRAKCNEEKVMIGTSKISLTRMLQL